MKLAALILVTTLGLGSLGSLGSAAHAEPARPRDQLRQLLLERFDRNDDGRLEPQERRQAIRALRRLTRRMAMQERRAEMRAARQRGLVRRLDTNRDGVVGPEEMPRGLARKLRPLDQNGDGWIDDRDQP